MKLFTFIDQETGKYNIEEVNRAYSVLKSGGLVISPTKVGYIMVGCTFESIKRKFDLKQRKKSKSAVILTRYENLEVVSLVPSIHQKFISLLNQSNLLCGFILKRNKDAFVTLNKDLVDYTKQPNETSCFVINHGLYSEQLEKFATLDNILLFASSANKSGTGNKGKFKNIGDSIIKNVNYSIIDDEYVAQRYQDKEAEQGVMIDLTSDVPSLIRLGLFSDKIVQLLSLIYGEKGFTINHGAYP